MSIDLQLTPKRKRPAGEPCCEPVVYPDVERAAGRAHGPGGEGPRRPDPPAAGRRPAKARRQGVRLRADAALRRRPAHRLAPPQGAARGGARRLRAHRPVGLLLRAARGAGRVRRAGSGRARRPRRMPRERTPPTTSTSRSAPATRRRRARSSSGGRLRLRRGRLLRSGGRVGVRGRALRRSRARPSCPRPRCWPAWAAATRPRWPSCARARWCSTSARAAASTCSCRPGASARSGRAYGLDMTEEMLALARRNAARGRGHQRRVPARPDRGHPAARRDGRRRDLQLRRQPLPRQARGAARGLPGPGARAAGSGSPTSSPRTGSARVRARRARELGPGASPARSAKSEYERMLAAAGFDEGLGHVHPRVADGLHGAIVNATKPAVAPRGNVRPLRP